MKLDGTLGQSVHSRVGRAAPVLVLASSACVFLTYLIPQWYSFVTSKAFVFTNGWDEEFYLSWQGVEAAKAMAGTYSLHLSWLMHMMGISGAVQNLLLDTLLPPLTAMLVYLSLRRYELPAVAAAGYAVLICFGSVLFNANNPLISLQLGQTRTATVWFMSAWEVYPSILRTPNPEISFFLISAAVYGYARFGKWWLLLLPLPLLYFFCAIAYGFVLVAGFTYAQLRLRFGAGWRAAVVCSGILTFLAAGAGLIALSFAMGLYQPENLIRNTPYLFSETRRPQFPVGAIVLAVLFTVGVRAGWLRLERRWMAPILILGLTSIGIVNLHIFTGFMMSQKNYYDYGLSVVFPIALVIAIQAIRWEVARSLALIAALISVSALCYKSQKIWFGQATKYGAEIAPGIDRLRKDPLRAIIPDWSAAGRAAYSTPKLLSPLSYIYWYAINQCAGTPAWAADAWDFESKHLVVGSREYTEALDVAEKVFAAEKLQPKPASDLPHCAGADLRNRDFYVIGPN
jgi:hypothetical protein